MGTAESGGTSAELKREIQKIRRRRYEIESGKAPRKREYEITSLAAREAHLRRRLLEGESR